MTIQIFRKRKVRIALVSAATAIILLNLLAVATLAYFFLTNTNRNQAVLMIPSYIRRAGEQMLKTVQNLPYFSYYFLPSKLPVYEISIDQDKLNELNKNLPTAEDGWMLQEENKDSKSAKFVFLDKEYDVKVRYRGIGSWHWLYPQKSWLINFKDPAYFNQTKKIHLIVPFDRDYIGEYFDNWRAKKLGLAVPKSYFVELRVNGHNNGVYFASEPLDAAFLEKAELNPETNFYTEKTLNQPIYENIKYWEKNSTNPNEDLDNYAELGRLLEIINHPDKEYFLKNIWNIVDKENFLAWNVHSILSGSIHQDWSHNANWYFDVTSGKFKIIPQDVGISDNVVNHGINLNYHPLITRLLTANNDYAEERNKMLWEYVNNEKNLKEDLAEFEKIYKEVRVAFYKDPIREFNNKFFDQVTASQKKLLKDTSGTIKQILGDSKVNAVATLNLSEKKNILTGTPISAMLEISSQSVSPTILNDIRITNTDPQIKNKLTLFYDNDNNGILNYGDKYVDSFEYNSATTTVAIKKIDIKMYSSLGATTNNYSLAEPLKLNESTHRFFILPADGGRLTLSNLQISLGITNSITKDAVDAALVYRNDGIFTDLEKINATIDEFVAQNPFFSKIGRDTVTPNSGTFTISRNIIIPKNLKVIISPGTSIYLAKDTSIVSYSPVKAVGAPNRPINFLSLNQSEHWGVFAVLNTDDKSEFANVSFKNGGYTKINGVFFSGTLSLYHNKEAEVKNCNFTGANGDDSLNIKNSKAVVTDNYFYQNNYDAIDFDFIKDGLIENNKFSGNGNDAIDISGSHVLIKNNSVDGSGDKCISVGEKSYPTIEMNELSGCSFGIVVKDASEAIIKNNKISNSLTAGIASYVKKEIFGGAIIKLTDDNVLTGNKTDYDMGTGCVLEKITN